MNKQFDIIDVLPGESKRAIVSESVDFSSISELTCWLLVDVSTTEVKIIAVFSKQDIAKANLIRAYEGKKYNDLRIVESRMYTDRAIIKATPAEIKLRKKAYFDAGFQNISTVEKITYSS